MNDLELPPLDESSKCRSALLKKVVLEKIENEGGWISFSRFMELALYYPELGYYSGGHVRIGRGGDFITAPKISKLFGMTLAYQFEEILKTNQSACILELGAGDGSGAVDIVRELQHLNCLPKSYLILEISPHLIELQRKTLHSEVPEIFKIFHWIKELPENLEGIIFANEVFDALPVNLIEVVQSEIFEKGVIVDNNQLAWDKRPAVRKIREMAFSLNLAPPYTTEIAHIAELLIKKLASIIKMGLILIIDYGFKASEYYHPQRYEGTLMCHYKHYAHQNPFIFLGHQDITSHVNFTSLARVAEKSGLNLLGFCSQAQFLLNSGIVRLLSREFTQSARSDLLNAKNVNKLLSPSEMGELFKVLALGKNISSQLVGFSDRNRINTL